jgi:hypothetical protein
MPTWNDILAEIQRAGSTHDLVRRRYLKKLAAKTKRNVIIYYSAWLQKSDLYRQQTWEFTLNDADKNGLMATIYEMPRAKGLDLVLHTPGGDMAAMFGTDIRAIVPQTLSVHHAAILTMNMTPAVKLIENDRGVAFVQQIQQMLIRAG